MGAVADLTCTLLIPTSPSQADFLSSTLRDTPCYSTMSTPADLKDSTDHNNTMSAELEDNTLAHSMMFCPDPLLDTPCTSTLSEPVESEDSADSSNTMCPESTHKVLACSMSSCPDTLLDTPCYSTLSKPAESEDSADSSNTLYPQSMHDVLPFGTVYSRDKVMHLTLPDMTSLASMFSQHLSRTDMKLEYKAKTGKWQLGSKAEEPKESTLRRFVKKDGKDGTDSCEVSYSVELASLPFISLLLQHPAHNILYLAERAAPTSDLSLKFTPETGWEEEFARACPKDKGECFMSSSSKGNALPWDQTYPAVNIRGSFCVEQAILDSQSSKVNSKFLNPVVIEIPLIPTMHIDSGDADYWVRHPSTEEDQQRRTRAKGANLGSMVTA